MSNKKVTILVCDSCGVEYDWPRDVSVETIRRYAEVGGWTFLGRKDYCSIHGHLSGIPK